MRGSIRELSQARIRGTEPLRQLLRHPAVRQLVRCLGAFSGAFLLSGSAVGGAPMPFAAALTAALPFSLPCAASAIGGCLGYFRFWGIDAALGPICVILLVFAAIGIFRGTTAPEQTWFMPAICAIMTALVGLIFFLDAPFSLLRLSLLLARIAAAFAVPAAYRLALFQKQRAAMLLLLGTAVSGMTALNVGSLLNFGIAGACAVCLFAAAAPDGILTAAVSGVAVDLSGTTAAPMSALLCLAVLLTRFFRQRFPGFAKLTAAALGILALGFAAVFPDRLLFSLCIGGGIGLLLPAQLLPRPAVPGAEPTVKLQQRLRQIGGVLGQMQHAVPSQEAPPPISPEMIYDRAADKVCRCCVLFRVCWGTAAEETYQSLCAASGQLLRRGNAEASDFPAAFTDRCRHIDGFVTAVNQELDSLLYRRQYRTRTGEQQQLLSVQLGCLSRLLCDTAREADWRFPAQPRYRLESGCTEAAKNSERVCGDCCMSFAAEDTVEYLLVCDGMGTGPEAAKESRSAVRLLSELLKAGCDPQDALQMLNSLYILRGGGCFSAVDIARVDLCSGEVLLYKWGGAPSYLKRNSMVKKLGAGAPPPGIGVGKDDGPERIVLSLQKGEILLLTTDGLTADETMRRLEGYAGRNLRELSAYIVAGAQRTADDDRTAAALCLYPRHAK